MKAGYGVPWATAAGRSPGRGLTMHDEGKYMYGGAEWATVAEMAPCIRLTI